MCAPEYVRTLSDKVAQDGDALELSCFVKGDPEPSVTWTKNGKVSDPTIIFFCIIWFNNLQAPVYARYLFVHY